MKKALAAFVALLLGVATYLVGTTPARAAVAGTITGWTTGATVTVKFPDGSTKGNLDAALIDLEVTGDDNTTDILQVYCIQINVDTFKGVDYVEGDFTDVNDHARVLWVLLHGYPNLGVSALEAAAGIDGLTENEAIAATQTAIWHFSDGATPTAGLTTNAQAVYDYLTDNATPVTNPPAPSLELSPGSQEGFAGQAVGPFTLAMSGSGKADLSATNGATITDGGGHAITKAGDGDTIYLTRSTPGSSTLTASATTDIEAGRSFVSKGKQTLILAASDTVLSTDSATATWKKPTTVTEIAAPTFTDGTCTTDNKVSTPEVTGIEWKIDGTPGWGNTVTVTAKAKPGYVIKDGIQTEWTHTFPAKPDCAVALVAPTVVQSTCVPGQPGQATQPSVTLPPAQDHVTYSQSGDVVPGGTVVVTAKAAEGYTFSDTPGWKINDKGTEATFTVHLDKPDCLVAVTPVAPTVSQSEACDVQGSYTIPETTGVVYQLDGKTIEPGTYAGPVSGKLTAVAEAGYQLTNPTWSFDLQVAKADICVAPVAPEVSQPETCDVQGSYTIPETEGVVYQLDGKTIEPGTYAGPVSGKLTAVAEAGYQLTNPAWSFDLHVAKADVCVAPVAPTVSQSETCDVQGSYTIPETTGVLYQLDGKTIEPGTYAGPVSGTLTAVAEAGYQLTNPAWSFDLQVAKAGICVTPVAPTVSWEICEAPGQPGGIVITPATTEGIDYTVDGRTVTATAQPGYSLLAPDGWKLGPNGTATFEVIDDNPDTCIPPQPDALTGTDTGKTMPICVVPGNGQATYQTWTQDWTQPYVWNQDKGEWVLGKKVYQDKVYSEPITVDNPYCIPPQPDALTGTDTGQTEPICVVPGNGQATYQSWTQDWTQPFVWDDTTHAWVPGDKQYGEKVYSEPITVDNPYCLIVVAPVAPTVSQSETCEVEGSYTIPQTEGVVYLLDGQEIAAGTYAGPVSGTLTAQAAEGYQLADSTWSYDLVVHPTVACASPSTPPTDSPTTPTDNGSTPPNEGGQTPTPGNQGTLPHTGGDVGGLVGTGLLVLLAGAGLVALTARRRPRGRHQ